MPSIWKLFFSFFFFPFLPLPVGTFVRDSYLGYLKFLSEIVIFLCGYWNVRMKETGEEEKRRN